MVSYKLIYSLFIIIQGVTATIDVKSLCLSKQRSCGDCISANPSCTWCTGQIDSFTYLQKRCQERSENNKSCSSEQIIDEVTTKQILKNESFISNGTKLIQLNPQETKLRIRSGEIVRTNITYKKLMDYPLDLYYVLDLSLSMQDDLEILKSFGSTLVDQIKNITDNVQLGFGTFVDKVLMPFASDDPNLLKLICPNQKCQPTFGFRHQLSLTSDGLKFKEAVDKTVISTNIDVPEGSLDALMQIAVCKDIVKWRPQALHVILLTTDAEPHIAMDGKLANVHDLNEAICQLKRISNDSSDYEYDRSLTHDYPSLGQLRHAFRENQIQTIFAVTKEVETLYKSFPSVFTNSYVETLSNDSSNIMTVISNAYDQIKDVFSFTEPKFPKNVQGSYRILCPNSTVWLENTLKCTNVPINAEVILQLVMNASCPVDNSTNYKLNISSASLSEISTINLEYICSCNCNSSFSNSSSCSGRGSSKCGICTCDKGFSGPNCQCVSNKTTSELEQKCRSLENNKECSGYGDCDCGVCKCKSKERFGEHCQCIPTGCLKQSGATELCGGAEKGSCKNCDNDQRCECNVKNGWFYNNETQLCDCNSAICINPNSAEKQACSGRGKCVCDKCVCDQPEVYTGDYCEVCGHPNCSESVSCATEKLQSCVRCLNENKVGHTCLEECQNQKIYFQIVEEFPNCSSCQSAIHGQVCGECADFDENIFKSIQCKITMENGCDSNYKVVWHKVLRSYHLIVKRQNFEEDCPAAINPLLIALPVGGSVILAGIIAMAAWKIVQNKLDEKRYEEFIKDVKATNWNRNTVNPMYKKAEVRVVNPKFMS